MMDFIEIAGLFGAGVLAGDSGVPLVSHLAQGEVRRAR
jgi:hypothetical protein